MSSIRTKLVKEVSTIRVTVIAMTQSRDEFKVWLQAQMDARGWGVRETARRAKVSHPRISDILNQGAQPTLDTCKKLSKAFDVPLQTLLVMAGHDKKPMGWDAEVEEIVELFRGLDKERRDNILAMARLEVHRSRAKEHAGSKPRDGRAATK